MRFYRITEQVAEPRPRLRGLPARRQGGVFAVMFAGTLLLMLGICAIVLDLGPIYNRKAELHGMAKAVALAAAGQLDGTAAGVSAALNRAAATAETYRHSYRYNFVWSDSAIRFSTSPARSGNWIDAEGARGRPAGLYYVEIDTSMLTDGSDSGDTMLMGALFSSSPTFTVSDRAVAGRSNLRITPFAVCAMSPDAAQGRPKAAPVASQELVEFGFRRGVNYDLMQLSPSGATPENFIVDPIAAPGQAYTSANTSLANVGPFVCSGKVWTPSVMGGSIHVTRPFPLADLYRQLNSRFDEYEGNVCDPHGAPPDFNILPFAFDTLKFMDKPGSQSAAVYTKNSRLETIADPDPSLATNTAPMYGVLWSYAKAAKFSAYKPNAAEPANGWATFATGDWAMLYPPSTKPASYPGSGSTTPYGATAGDNYKAPSDANLLLSQAGRRVLNIPLLDCPVPSGTDADATVKGIGRFFMTVQASQTSLHAEFAGVIPESALTGQVELYP